MNSVTVNSVQMRVSVLLFPSPFGRGCPGGAGEGSVSVGDMTRPVPSPPAPLPVGEGCKALRENFNRIHSARNANTGNNTAVSFDVSPSTVPNTMPETASANPHRSRRALSAVNIIQRPCRYTHNPASTNTWHRLSIRCTTYSTAIRLIGSSIHAALTISAMRVAAGASTPAFPFVTSKSVAPSSRAFETDPGFCPSGNPRMTSGWGTPCSPVSSFRTPRGGDPESVFHACAPRRHPTNRNRARSIQNTSTPLIRWITMLVTLNGQGSPLPKYQLTENVSEANGRRRKLEGDDSAEFTHATSVECPRVMWIAALSTMFG